jgi:hypothetical protein
MANLRLRSPYAWTEQVDSNWVGRARCDPNTRYYGKVGSATECKNKCLLDLQCKTWTYNNNNGYMGIDTINECWGMTENGTPNKDRWGGFISGGY